MNTKKLFQAINYLLSRNGYRMNYTKLIKLLYLSDRKSLATTGYSITGDSYVSMPKGPVLSNTYNLIKNDGFIDSRWCSLFYKENYDLISRAEDTLPTDELSRREIEILSQVDEEYKDWNQWQLIKFVHDPANVPEWKDPNGSSSIISESEILEATGWSQEEIDDLREEQRIIKNEERALLS